MAGREIKMLDIELEKNIRVEADAHQYILKLYSEKKNKSGKKSSTVLGYHSTINSALKNYLNYTVRNSNCKTIKEAIELYEKTEKRIEELVKI